MSSPSAPALRLPLRPSAPHLPRARAPALAAGSSLALSLSPSSRASRLLKPLAACGAERSFSSSTTGHRPAPLLLHQRRRHGPPAVAATVTSKPVLKDPKKYQEWDSVTAKFAGAANIPFLLLQLPQIVLNARNLLAGNKTALFAVPWLGMLTGLLGNLSLLSYFAKKKETEAVIVQTLGVISTYAVLVQLAMAESMPVPQFVATSVVVAAGLILNFLNYCGWIPGTLWLLWEDFITVGGLAVLPQVMWSTFVPFIPNSVLPGIISGSLAIAAVAMARMGKLSDAGAKFWTNYLNPSNIKGLSAFSMLLAMLGNGLMIPRAVFIRDLMWFTGSAWASVLQGWGFTLWRDTIAYGNSSPLTSLKELFLGK
ncbi:hypothetical protein HU200_063354 [Digitaria exilis]|uniref:Maltose excess protein 1-like, chloroplastic n=1 Tax=Digitaria exilis TaxID=1010633 RepID=A0A835DXA4_9POAL|nr:hypothetical protein HU200_063354 [Digitaria exilis]